MEAVVGFLGQLLKQIVFSFVFFWPGWLVVKVLTIGRYPRSIHPGKADWFDYEFLSFIGVATVVAAVALIACLWP